jgi:hypothetical protein
MTGRDSITRTRARAPGAEGDPPSKAVHDRVLGPTLCGITEADHEVHERRTQTKYRPVNAGSRLNLVMLGKAPPDMPAFQPYRGKPAVRNDRGDRGNVGIIRSPVRASILPDCGGRSVMSVPTAISETSSQNIPLKGRTDSRDPAEFWPQRLFAFELRRGDTQLGPSARISAGIRTRTLLDR